MVTCTFSHFEALAKGEANNFFPVVLKPELVEKCGFVENKKYPLLPQAREFSLTLPIPGENKNELFAYIKNNGECFGRTTSNGHPSSVNFYQLHQLQNIYFTLTGNELNVKL